jgi:thiamine biosynthesis lipoprotein
MSAPRHHTGAFRAMDTGIEITAVGIGGRAHQAALREAAAAARAWERLFSRFDRGSTLSRLNDAGGVAVPVEPAFLELLARAMRAVVETGGRFNPAILPRLEALGYDRTFAAIGTGSPPPASAPAPAPVWDDVLLDRARGTVRLPAGMRIDLGGIAKGAFVDRLAARFAAWPGGCVNAGGDLVAWGEPPDGDRWRVALATPGGAGLTLALDPHGSAGVATSGTGRRQWQVNGNRRHHLVDPATGMPAVTPLATATVVAASATDAEIAAKHLLLGGDALIHGDLAVLVDRAGAVRTIERSRPDAEVPLPA